MRTADRPRHFRQFIVFMRNAWRLILVVRWVLSALIALIVLDGLAIAHFEDIGIADSLYFSFVTAFTIGYGDIVPVSPIGRVLALSAGLVGLIMTGLVIAINTRALAHTVQEQRQQAGA